MEVSLETERLILDDFNVEEAELVAQLAGDIRVVEMTASIPYPYEPQMAVDWISTHKKQKDESNNHIFAIREKNSRTLIGCINIGFNERHDRGYVGYWIGHNYWGKGYCTEALKEIIRYGFSFSNINKIWAEHKTDNVASGKVMEKAGMTHEGIMRKHYRQKEGEYLDMSVKSILRSEYNL